MGPSTARPKKASLFSCHCPGFFGPFGAGAGLVAPPPRPAAELAGPIGEVGRPFLIFFLGSASRCNFYFCPRALRARFGAQKSWYGARFCPWRGKNRPEPDGSGQARPSAGLCRRSGFFKRSASRIDRPLFGRGRALDGPGQNLVDPASVLAPGGAKTGFCCFGPRKRGPIAR